MTLDEELDRFFKNLTADLRKLNEKAQIKLDAFEDLKDSIRSSHMPKAKTKKAKKAPVIAMTNIRPKNTGLPMTIWVQPRTGKEGHGPRIKVQKTPGEKVTNPADWVSVTIGPSPRMIGSGLSNRDFNIVKKFILKNKTELLRLWEDEIDPIEFVAHIEKVDEE